jgi:hypothetical protein
VEHDDEGCEDLHRDGMSRTYYGNLEDQQSPIQAIQDNILDSRQRESQQKLEYIMTLTSMMSLRSETSVA